MDEESRKLLSRSWSQEYHVPPMTFCRHVDLTGLAKDMGGSKLRMSTLYSGPSVSSHGSPAAS